MSDNKRENNELAELTPSARALDLEYGTPPPEPDSGIEVRCRNCGHGAVLPFDITPRAWDLLVELVCTASSVSRRALLDDSGTRPTDVLLQARGLLVQALDRVATPEAAQEWLKLQGWSLRRVHYARSFTLDKMYSELLEAFRPALMLQL